MFSKCQQFPPACSNSSPQQHVIAFICKLAQMFDRDLLRYSRATSQVDCVPENESIAIDETSWKKKKLLTLLCLVNKTGAKYLINNNSPSMKRFCRMPSYWMVISFMWLDITQIYERSMVIHMLEALLMESVISTHATPTSPPRHCCGICGSCPYREFRKTADRRVAAVHL